MDPASWKNLTPDQIYHYFMEQLVDEKVKILDQMLDNPSETKIDLLELIDESRTELIFLERAAELENLVARYSKQLPVQYEKQYGFIEQHLINYYLFKGDLAKVKNRLRIVRKYPLTGVSSVTLRALYQLIYYGHYQEALDYAKDIWRPLRDSNEIFGLAHAHCCMTIYLDELEQAWHTIRKGDKPDWEDFIDRMEKYGIDRNVNNFGLIIESLEKPFNREEVAGMIDRTRKSDLVLFLNIQFLKFMNERFGVPFMLSDLWWNMIADGKLFRKGKTPGDFFYASYNKLDHRFASHYDHITKSNDLEMFGRVFGLKYIYYFLAESGLISDKATSKMKINIDALEFMFEKMTYGDLWTMTFVFSWPRLDSVGPDRKDLYESTFSLYEGEYESVFHDYQSRRFNKFPPGIRKKLVSDLQKGDMDELPW